MPSWKPEIMVENFSAVPSYRYNWRWILLMKIKVALMRTTIIRQVARILFTAVSHNIVQTVENPAKNFLVGNVFIMVMNTVTSVRRCA